MNIAALTSNCENDPGIGEKHDSDRKEEVQGKKYYIIDEFGT